MTAPVPPPAPLPRPAPASPPSAGGSGAGGERGSAGGAGGGDSGSGVLGRLAIGIGIGAVLVGVLAVVAGVVRWTGRGPVIGDPVRVTAAVDLAELDLPVSKALLPDVATRFADYLATPPAAVAASRNLAGRYSPAEIRGCTSAKVSAQSPTVVMVTTCADSAEDANKVVQALRSAGRAQIVRLAGMLPDVPGSYPIKPEARAAPQRASFSPQATAQARRLLAGKAVYTCAEIQGISSPPCGDSSVALPDEQVIAAAASFGARQVWLRCGDSNRGFPAAHQAALRRFVPKAHAANLTVVCWDVPNFWDVAADAARLAKMAPFVDSVAADLESGLDRTKANGFKTGGGFAGPELQSRKGQRWAAAYAGWVRHDLDVAKPGAGGDYPLIVITQQPQTHPLYPFAELADGFNVVSPMAYRSPSRFVDGDPNKPETGQAGNPFVATAVETVQRLGFGSDRHDVVVTMQAADEDEIRSAPGQIRTDVAGAREAGALGVAAYNYGGLAQKPDRADAFRSAAW